jgi:hypothetical protein
MLLNFVACLTLFFVYLLSFVQVDDELYLVELTVTVRE